MNTSNEGKENARPIAGSSTSTIRSVGTLALTLLLMAAPVRAETVAEREAKFAAAEGIGLAQVTLAGDVLAIDTQKRELTMTDAMGNRSTLKVDASVPAFEKIAAGDRVKVVYFISGKGEVRKPTKDEEKAPFTVLEKSDLPQSPFGKDLKNYKMVTVIESIDASGATVTIKGAEGHNTLVKLKDKSAAGEYKKGDTIVITYTEPIVASLEKIAAKK